ncbi:MAG: TetR/AcrR family transcriptional regulator [Gammaproteobacteria bacterium]|nr:TetR/AcrR family transcriptional regulator [Gammaproteobacteria bacterium]
MDAAHAARYSKGKDIRRRRILQEAQWTLSDGPNALSYRKLARAAGVTVPTIYNLVGNKEALYRALSHEILDAIENEMLRAESADPLEQLLAPTRTVLRLVSKKPAVVRAGYIGFDELYRSSDRDAHYEVRKRRVGLQEQAIQGLVSANLLRGEVPAKALESLLSQSATQNGRDWAFKVVSAQQLRRNLLIGAYTVLLSDATPVLRTLIVDLMNEL